MQVGTIGRGVSQGESLSYLRGGPCLCVPQEGPLHFLINLLFGAFKKNFRLACLFFLSGLRLKDQVDNYGDFIDFRWGYFNILLRWLNGPLM